MSYRTSVASALREPIEHLLWVIFFDIFLYVKERQLVIRK
jgi:hypothetical protein